MAAIVEADGRIRQLDRPAMPDESITEADVQDPSKLVRLVLRLLKDIALLKRRFWPKRLDFEDIECVAGETIRLEHGFGGRVRWWQVEWTGTGVGTFGGFEQTAATDRNTLVLLVVDNGTATVRVEQAG
jgi:hypothetical protein